MGKKLSLYASLVQTIQVTLQDGLLAAQQALEYARLKTYWQIGRAIRQAVDQSQGQLKTGSDFYQQISRDIYDQSGLDLSAGTLGSIERFYREYPQCPKPSRLSFTHYELLVRVSNKRERAALEKKAIKEDLAVLGLRDVLKERRLELVAPSSDRQRKRLPCRRGVPYLYRTIKRKSVDGSGELRIDCGFYMSVRMGGRIRAATSSVLNKTRVVSVVKKSRTYSVHSSRHRADQCYTYLARVLRVVDGDTFDVAIDVGFGVELNERIRLKGINAPERKTSEGQLAKKYVERLFKKNPWVVIRSEREGVYKRWIADVFVMGKERDPYVIAAQGAFLNQQMVDDGMADRM